MAFGCLITKWRVLRTALEVPLRQAGTVFQACCHLHNYVIDEQGDCQSDPIDIVYEIGGAVLGYVPSDVGAAPASGSILRQKLVQKLLSKSLSRPELNVKHRIFEDERRGMYTVSA